MLQTIHVNQNLPLQIAVLAQCIESLAVLAACSDDKLLIPEKFVD